METQSATPDGAVTAQTVAHYEERARGGAGLIIVEFTCVDPPVGRGNSNQLCMHHRGLVNGHAELTDAVHAQGARVFLQLHHAGRQTHPDITGHQPVSPSPIASTLHEVEPRALTVPETEELVEKFVFAAQLAHQAGYDGVEIHGAHGYLVSSFISPYTNRRTDAYGGSLENRLRFPTAIVRGIKRALGDTFPVSFRISVDEFIPGGATLEHTVQAVQLLEAAGVDVIHASTGIAETIERNVEPMSFPQGWRLPLAAVVKQAVRIPVIGVGVIRDPDVAESAVREGQVDFIALGRALLADPRWPEKARQGQAATIVRCTSCCYCLEQVVEHRGVRCSVNPRAGRESRLGPLKPAQQARRVLIAGAGPGGMQAAVTLAERGHQVQLYDRQNRLGGMMVQAATPPHKEKWFWLLEYFQERLRQLRVPVVLGTRVTPELVAALQPDAVILATGARPLMHPLTGEGSLPVVSALDILDGNPPAPEGQRVVVLGSRGTGVEIASLLAIANQVTIVARSPAEDNAANIDWFNRRDLLRRLNDTGVRFLNGYEVSALADRALVLAAPDGATMTLPADMVVVARGWVPNTEVADALAGPDSPEVHVIGNAASPRRIADAIWEAYALALRM